MKMVTLWPVTMQYARVSGGHSSHGVLQEPAPGKIRPVPPCTVREVRRCCCRRRRRRRSPPSGLTTLPRKRGLIGAGGWRDQEYLTGEERGRVQSPSQTFRGMASGRTVLVSGRAQRVEAGLRRQRGVSAGAQKWSGSCLPPRRDRDSLTELGSVPHRQLHGQAGKSPTRDCSPTARNYC